MLKRRNKTENKAEKTDSKNKTSKVDTNQSIELTPLEKANQEKLDLIDTLRRLQAEFENFKKRTEIESVQRITFANIELIKAILPVLDNFELALKAECKDDSFCKGMKMVHDQLIAVLESAGVKKIEEINIKFNPNLHEALLQEEVSGCESNTVLEIFNTGYMIKDRVLRHAKVKVSKEPSVEKSPAEKSSVELENDTE